MLVKVLVPNGRKESFMSESHYYVGEIGYACPCVVPMDLTG